MNCVLGAVLVRMESLRFVPGAFLFNENLYLFTVAPAVANSLAINEKPRWQGSVIFLCKSAFLNHLP
jgi:hypothetical protein